MKTLHVGKPNVGNIDTFISYITDIYESRRLTNNGPFVQRLENLVCQMLNVRNCVAVCNATIGLQIVAKAMELTGEVIVPAFTFIATAHALEWIGLKPVFCDVLPSTHCINPDMAADILTSRTSAILGVHLWGNSCDTVALQLLCEQYGLKLFFDAAHAFPCPPIGNFGDAEVFSLHATKAVNGFEGGLITTNDDGLAERCRKLRNFGFADYDVVDDVGTNGKLSEVHAVMALTTLADFQNILEANVRNYKLYRECLRGLPGIELQRSGDNCHYIVVQVDECRAGISRDALVNELQINDILARRYFSPGCHKSKPYIDREFRPYLPVTNGLSESILALPTGTAVNKADIERVCSVIRRALGAYD